MGFTPDRMRCLSSSAVKESLPNLEMARAAIPDICGHAIDVP